MSDICRLCLSFSTENMRPLTDCDGIVYNSISFKINIPINNKFPTHICPLCFSKLSEFNNFCLQVQKNEQDLYIQLNKGESALQLLYEQIKNEFKHETSEFTHYNKEVIGSVKENENILEEIKTEVLNSDCDIDFDSEDDVPLLKTRDCKHETSEFTHDNKEVMGSVKENENILEEIKTEVLNSDCDIDFDSEDNVPLLKTRDCNIEVSRNTQITKTDIEYSETNGFTNNILNYKCLTCFETFISQNKLLSHYNSVHKVKTEIKGNQYIQVDNNEKVLYKCSKCDKTYNNVRAVNKHAKTHCDQNFHCKVCGRTYKTVSEIIRHGRAHNGTKISCSFECGFATVYSGALKSHERRHREEFKYKCEICGKSFQVKTWYEQHQNVHSGAKPYICHCGAAFHMDRYLKAHCSAVHPETSKKRYVCVHCSQPCGDMKALTRHLKEHGITSSVLCDLCGKTLSSSEQLAIHRRLHTGDKPYSCSICNKRFAKRSNLKLHQVTHSGERAHACAACGKRYSQRSTLRRHLHRHHSTEKKRTTSQAEIGAHQKICS